MFKTLKRCIEELPIFRAMKAREDGDEAEALRIEQEYENSLPPYIAESEIEEATHEIIHRLENVLTHP